MRNRAKCKLCNDIIESFHKHDYVACKCGEIAVNGGEAMYAFATDFDNFLRVDDQGNEAPVTYRDKEPKSGDIHQEEIPVHKAAKEELIVILDEEIKRFDQLPPNAQYRHVVEADLHALRLLLSSIFKAS